MRCPKRLPPTARHQRAPQERPRCPRCSPAVGQEVHEQSKAQRCKAIGQGRLRLGCHCETRQQCTARHKAAGFAWRRSNLGLGLYGRSRTCYVQVPADMCEQLSWHVHMTAVLFVHDVPTVRMLSMRWHVFLSRFPSFVEMRWHPEEGHKYIGVCPIRPVQLYGRSP